jgi:hypothetical protein
MDAIPCKESQRLQTAAVIHWLFTGIAGNSRRPAPIS